MFWNAKLRSPIDVCRPTTVTGYTQRMQARTANGLRLYPLNLRIPVDMPKHHHGYTSAFSSVTLRRIGSCDRLTSFVVIWKHFCFILSTGTRIRFDSVMRRRSSSRGRNVSASVTVTVTVIEDCEQLAYNFTALSFRSKHSMDGRFVCLCHIGPTVDVLY